MVHARTMRLLRGLSGAVTAAIVILAIVAIFGQIWFSPGPGLVAILGQVIAAVIAVLLQRIADRRPNSLVIVAAIANIAILLNTLWLWWWR